MGTETQDREVRLAEPAPGGGAAGRRDEGLQLMEAGRPVGAGGAVAEVPPDGARAGTGVLPVELGGERGPAVDAPHGPMIARPAAGSEEDRLLTGLALRARDGAPGALAELIAATRGDVERYIRRLADPQSAEELAQETYIRAMRGLPRFAGRSSVRTWLRSIARHTVLDRYRAQAARPRTLPVEAGDGAERDARPQGSRIDEHVALADLLAGLTEERRTAFVLTRLHGYSYAEAARITAVPVGTVRSRVARAREDLVRALRAADRAGRPGRR